MVARVWFCAEVRESVLLGASDMTSIVLARELTLSLIGRATICVVWVITTVVVLESAVSRPT